MLRDVRLNNLYIIYYKGSEGRSQEEGSELQKNNTKKGTNHHFLVK